MRAALLAFLTGVLLEACHRSRPAPSSAGGVVAWWVADRARHRVVGLGRDLIAVEELLVERPVEVETSARGGLAILRALGPDARARHELLQLSGDGARPLRTRLGPARVLREWGGNGWLCIEDRQRLVRIDRGGRASCILGRRGLSCLALGAGRALVGCEGGRLSLLELRPEGARVLVERDFRRPLHDVAPGPRTGEWWVLSGADGARLSHLDSRLDPLWESETGVRTTFLAVDRARRVAWLADEERPWLRCVGQGDRVRGLGGDLPSSGAQAAACPPDGGLLLLCAGALLNLDSSGGLRPGQGGFGFAVDLARAQ